MHQGRGGEEHEENRDGREGGTKLVKTPYLDEFRRHSVTVWDTLCMMSLCWMYCMA